MIPYGIMGATILWEDEKETKIRMLDLSVEGFSFRLSLNYPEILKIKQIDVWFLLNESYKRTVNETDMKSEHETGHKTENKIAHNTEHITENKTEYNTEYLTHHKHNRDNKKYGRSIRWVTLSDYIVQMTETTEFYRVYSVITEDRQYQAYASALMCQYMEYIRLKTECEDAVLSEQLTGYPAKREDEFQNSLEDWLCRKMKTIKEQYFHREVDENEWEDLLRAKELIIQIDSEESQSLFLNTDAEKFYQRYLEKNSLLWHPISKLMVTGVQIGNQFCLEHFPDKNRILQIMKQACSQGLRVVIAFPPMKEHDTEKVLEILETVKAWKRKTEIIVNDFGMAELINSRYSSFFSQTAGILLNKRKKDTRISYKIETEKQQELLKESSVNAEFFRKWIEKSAGIRSFSFEACGYNYEIPSGEHSLYVPFYQMNTSGHCTLYAMCKYGDRGKQSQEKHCPRYCDQKVFLYPEILNMIGWRNSLFGIDEKFFSDLSYAAQLCRNGIKRLVLNFPE